MRTEYYNLKGFENLYLEDSYLLGFHFLNGKASLSVEAILTEKHPLYSKPRKEEQYCYYNVLIEFDEVRDLKLSHCNFVPTGDLSGTQDYGNIDWFYLEKDHYFFGGDWGEVILVSDQEINVKYLKKWL